MSAYVEKIILVLNGRQLDDTVESVSSTIERKVTAVNTMNRAGTAKGFKRGNTTYTLEIKTHPIDDASLPNWETIQRTGTELTLIEVPSSGKNVTWRRVTINRIAQSNADGDVTKTLSAMAIDRIEG